MGGPLEVAMQRVHEGGADRGLGGGGGESGEHKHSSLRQRAKTHFAKFLSSAKSPRKEGKESSKPSQAAAAAPVSVKTLSNDGDDDFGPRPGSHHKQEQQRNNNDFSPRPGSHHHQSPNDDSGPRSGTHEQQRTARGEHERTTSSGSIGGGNQSVRSTSGEVHSGEHFRGSKHHLPEEFKCPILNTLMAEPVIVASGTSYERGVIQLYFQYGHRQCYKTGVFLESDAVFNNTSLKTAIENWCDSNGVTRPLPPSPEIAREAVERAFRTDSSRSESFSADYPSSAGSTGDWSRPHSGVFQSEAELRLQQIHENGPQNSASVPSEVDEKPKRQFEPRHTWSEGLSKHSLDVDESSSSRQNSGRHDAIVAEDRSAASSPSSSMNYSSHTATYATPPRHSSAEPVDRARTSVPLPLTQTPASFGSEANGSISSSSSDRRLDGGAINTLVSKLQHKHIKEQEEAAVEIRTLTRMSAYHRLDLCEPDVLEALLPLLQSRYSQVQINSVAAVMNLSLERENKLKVARAGAIPYLIDVLKSGVSESQEHAAGAIFSLALNDENKMAIGVLGAIPPLIHLLRSNQQGARRDAAMALYHLSFSQMNRSKLIRAGGVGTFLGIVRDERSDMVSRALLILCNIAAMQDGRAALAEKDAVPILVNLLARGDEESSGSAPAPGEERKVNWAEVREHAAAALLLLSQHNFRFRAQALQAGAIEELQRLEVEGTPRAREKAAHLLSALREPPRGQEGGMDHNHASMYPRRAFNRQAVDLSKAESSVF